MTQTTLPPCTHKQANHQCGTNARYVLDRCRCDLCREARRRTDRERMQRNLGLKPPAFVDATPARYHVVELMEQGMGLKRIARTSGVSTGSLSKLMYGCYKRQQGPSNRISKQNSDRLLAVTIDVADGRQVPAREAKKIVRELIRRGWSKAEIGRHIHGPSAKSLQAVDGPKVMAGTLRTLRQLLTEPVPLRRHWTGSWYDPAKPVKWRNVLADTPGVPEAEEVTARGQLKCDICSTPLAEHGFTACWRTI